MVRAHDARRRQRGWPELPYDRMDEPSTEPATVEFTAAVLHASEAAGLRTDVTADSTLEVIEPVRPRVDV